MRRWTYLAVLLLLAVSSPARAEVGAEDVARAAAELERTRVAAGEAGAAWQAARDREEQARASLEGLMGEIAAGQLKQAEARAAVREQARLLYVTAGARAAGREQALVRAAYAGAVGRAGREAVNTLRAAVDDLARRRQQVQAAADDLQLLAARLGALAAAAGPELAAAEAEYQRLRAAWEAQEAARLRAEREAQEAASSTTSAGGSAVDGDDGPGASTAPVATTTTSPPVVVGTAFPPAVERWRGLVAVYFAAELVDPALAVIACESLGDPAVVNPLSGTAGLFQHHPLYWPERAAAAGFPGATPDNPEANVAAAAWLVDESVASGLPPWFFWACRP